jgi:hypothetical protein
MKWYEIKYPFWAWKKPITWVGTDSNSIIHYVIEKQSNVPMWRISFKGLFFSMYATSVEIIIKYIDDINDETRESKIKEQTVSKNLTNYEVIQ